MKKELIDLSFKITSYRHNKDLFNKDDNVMVTSDGLISQLRLSERKKPKQIGEFAISNINLYLANILSVNVLNLLSIQKENHFIELYDEIKYNDFKYDYDRIIVVNSFVVCDEYRGYNVLNELTETLVRDYYGFKNIIIFHAQPFQYNDINIEYYSKNRIIKDDNGIGMLGIDYYNLNKYFNYDKELSHYKIYQRMNECGFNRMGESNLFWLDPRKTIEKLTKKLI